MARCKNGTTKDRKTGECLPTKPKTGKRKPKSPSPATPSPSPLKKTLKRCKNGTTKDRKTGACVPKKHTETRKRCEKGKRWNIRLNRCASVNGTTPRQPTPEHIKQMHADLHERTTDAAKILLAFKEKEKKQKREQNELLVASLPDENIYEVEIYKNREFLEMGDYQDEKTETPYVDIVQENFNELLNKNNIENVIIKDVENKYRKLFDMDEKNDEERFEIITRATDPLPDKFLNTYFKIDNDDFDYTLEYVIAPKFLAKTKKELMK